MSSARYLALRRWEKPMMMSQLAIWPYRRCEKPMMMSSARYLALQKMWGIWPYADVISSLSDLTVDVRNLWWCHQLAIWPYRRCEKPMLMSSARYLALQKMWETYDDVISSLSGLTEDVRNLWWCHSSLSDLTEDVRNLWWCHQLAIWPYRRCEKPMMMSSARYLTLQKMWETYADVISSLSGLTVVVRNLWWCHQLAIWPYIRCEKPMLMSSARYLALQKMWETYDDVISSLSGLTEDVRNLWWCHSSLSDLTEDVRNLWWCHQLAIWPYRRWEKPMAMSSARYLALQKMWGTYHVVISSLSGLTEEVRNVWWCHQLAIWPYRRFEKPMMISSARYLALQKMWETNDDVIGSLSGLTEDVRNQWWCHQLAIWPYRRCEKPMMMTSTRYLELQKMWGTYDDVISSLSGLTEAVRNPWWCHQLAIWPYSSCEIPMMMSSARYLALQKMWETYADVISSLYGLTEDVRNLWWCHQLAIWPYRRCEKPMMMSQLAIWPYRRCKKPMMMSSAGYLALQKMGETYGDVISSLSGLTEDVRDVSCCHQLAIWPYRRSEKRMMMPSARYLALQKMWETYDDIISSLSGLTEDVRNQWWCHRLAIWPYGRCEKPMMMPSARYLTLQKMWETNDDDINSLSRLTEDVRNLWWCHQLAIWPNRSCEKPMMMSSARYLDLQKMWETYDDVISLLSGLTEDVRNLWWCHQLAIWPYRRCEKPMMMTSTRYLDLQKMWETYNDVISSLSGLTEAVRNLWWCHQLAIWTYRRCEKPMMMSSACYLVVQRMWETYDDVISSLSGLTKMGETYGDVISSVSGLTEDVRNLWWCHQLGIWPYRRCEKPMLMSSARDLALRRWEKSMVMSSSRYLALQKMWETYDDVISSVSDLTEDVRNLCWCHQLAIWPYSRCEKPMMMSSARYLALQKMWETYADVISSLSGLTEDVRNLWWCHQLAIWPYRRCEKPMMMSQLAIWPYRRCKKPMMMSSAGYLALQKMGETYGDVISSLSGLTEDVRDVSCCHQLAIWPYRRSEKRMMMPSARYLALQKMWETYDDVISSLSGLTEDVRNQWWCHRFAIWPYGRCEKPMMMSSARYMA